MNIVFDRLFINSSRTSFPIFGDDEDRHREDEPREQVAQTLSRIWWANFLPASMPAIARGEELSRDAPVKVLSALMAEQSGRLR